MFCDTQPNFLVSANSLFSSERDSDSNDGTAAVGTHDAPKETPTGAVGGGGNGLFDDEEEEDDDFFSDKSQKKPDSSK